MRSSARQSDSDHNAALLLYSAQCSLSVTQDITLQNQLSTLNESKWTMPGQAEKAEEEEVEDVVENELEKVLVEDVTREELGVVEG